MAKNLSRRSGNPAVRAGAVPPPVRAASPIPYVEPIFTDDEGVHTDALGNVFEAATVGGELAFQRAPGRRREPSPAPSGSSPAVDRLHAAARGLLDAEDVAAGAVRRARDAGVSWSVVAAAFGLSEAGARYRWGR